MPSKKKNTRAAQLQPQPAQSDYDTDTANVTDSAAPAMAPPPARTNTELNLLVLRRYVPDIERIISIAPFAVVYLFSPETQQWEKSGVEGTLFVCQLGGSQHWRYNVVILNRKSMDNFITELVSGEDIEITEQYVILQVLGEDGTPNIYGLWIFSDEEDKPSTREVVANAIQECAVRAESGRATEDEEEQSDEDDYSGPAPYNLDGVDERATPVQTQPSGQHIDLSALFSKPSAPQEPSISDQNRTISQPQYYSTQQPRFNSTADTDFFRSSHSPVAASQQRPQPPPQQNALLDLLKSAKKG
ncbi:hypothetical protein LTR37_007189 [Vermiconidia calcicola]|uniref:Uncharacterized protein n=1 Tax=Vermiconidia calcicola TaxID=1690605 RepID=A0ACC3NEF1_9PEZI|nr:hypothetical protein LTR37_007189 [Vermiconidia calcicola]